MVEEIKQDSVQDSTADETRTPEWVLRTRIEAELRTKLRPEYEQILTLWKETELDKVRKESEKIATEGIQKLFDDWRKNQEPPTHDQLQSLLQQEYETFTLPVDYYNDDGDVRTETFTIRELPQAAEKKFYKQFKEKILNNVSALKALSQAGIDQPFEEKAKAFLGMFDESFDMLAEAVVIVLNSNGKRKVNGVELDRAWVQNNLSSDRQWKIVDVQIKVNRLKDFFSALSQSGQSTQTMLEGLNFQQLQQLSR